MFFFKYMTWFVYMLRCADDSIYSGITKDLQRRLDEHNGLSKNGAKYTRARRPVSLIHQEQYENRSQASQREHELKAFSRQQKLALVNSYDSAE